MRINIDDAEVDDSLRYTDEGHLFTGEIVEVDRNGNMIELWTVVGIGQGKEHLAF